MKTFWKLIKIVVAIVVAMIVLAVFLVGLSLLADRKDKEFQINNVQRVLMNEPGRYTILYFSDNDRIHLKKKILFSPKLKENDSHLYVDVPIVGKIWVRYVESESNFDASYIKEFEIHIHNVSEIEGGGWSHGKYGSGQTVVIE